MKNRYVFIIAALALGLLSFGVGYTSLRSTTATTIALSPDTIYSNTITADSPISPTTPVKLIFIHHSCGGNWLADPNEEQPYGGLALELMENNYFVSATNYGWGSDQIGSSTDIPNWPEWFTDTVMSQVYTEYDQNICGEEMCFGDWTRMADPNPSGENEIIMFKSCYPNSDLYGQPTDEPDPGEVPTYDMTVRNAKAVYNHLLTYFAVHQDKLFIVITAPPMAEGGYGAGDQTPAERAANARAFNNWLVNNWLAAYPHQNVAVFDYYNVLTSNGGDIDTNDYAMRPAGNHHYWNGTQIIHTQTVNNNFAAYPVDDGHPSTAGHQKATAEFVLLLNVFYNRWKTGVAPTPPALHLTQPNGGEYWLAGSQQMIQWTTTGTVANVNLTYSTDSFATRHDIALNLSNTNSYNWTTPVTTSTTTLVRVESVISPTTVFDVSDAFFTLYQPGVMDQFIYLPLVLRNYAPAPPACAIPLTGVTINGPSSGVTNTTYTFSAAPTPANATPSIAYTWTPAPQSGQGTTSASYQWDTTGSKTISVSASHCSGSHTVNDDHTLTIQAAPSGNLVMPTDLVYMGAFRLPDAGESPLTFEYGGNAMSFNPDGHLTNTDAFSGSLFTMGHDRLAYGELPDGNQVAELSIPVPVNSRNVEDLPYAEFLQGFTDVLAGHFTVYEDIVRMGMSYLNHPATGPKLHLSYGWHLPPDTPVPTHAWVNADLSNPGFYGEWYIGDQDFNSVNGYMFTISTAWADTHTQGHYLATGRFRDGGWGGMGPALYAYTPWLSGGAAPVSGTHLSETVLLRYESSNNTGDIEHALNNYQHPDEWEGGDWITTPSGKSAVVLVGTKGTGAKYWYGWAHPDGAEYPCIEVEFVDDFTTCRLADGTPCPAEDLTGCTGHNDYRGWWSTRFDAQFIFYNPADLAQVAAGTMAAWDPQPYATLDVDEFLYLDPPEGDVDSLGRGDQRRMRIGAAAYDPTNGYLYVLEQFADGGKPVVHVWQVQ